MEFTQQQQQGTTGGSTARGSSSEMSSDWKSGSSTVGGAGGYGPAMRNVSEQERTYSLLGGGALLLSGLRHLSVGRMAVGGYLAYRGATGHCPIREALERTGILGGATFGQGASPASLGDPTRRSTAGAGSTFGQPREELWRDGKPRDPVEEASMESFPASDPPNYSAARGD